MVKIKQGMLIQLEDNRGNRRTYHVQKYLGKYLLLKSHSKWGYEDLLIPKDKLNMTPHKVLGYPAPYGPLTKRPTSQFIKIHRRRFTI